MTTEPTDAEILDLWESFVGEPTEEIPPSNSDKLCFARAALRSWGQSSGAGEVVYQASHKDGFWQDCSRERYEYLKAPKISSSVDWTLRILYTTPQPTQAQAGAVPLPKSYQASVLTSNSHDSGCRVSFSFGSVAEAEAWHESLIDQRHGIKGGQHGTDN